MSEAMVKPPPKKPRSPALPSAGKKDINASRERSLTELASILAMFGNNRAYVVLSSGVRKWVIHFEGDTRHTIVTFEGEKPVMRPEE